MPDTYQNRRGSAYIRPSVDSSQRLENSSLAVPASNTFAFFFEFSPVADTAGGTEFVIRYGSSAANAPAIGLRHRAAVGDYVVLINTSTGSASINIGDLTNGNKYRICVVASGVGASQAAAAATFAAAHTGANGTDEIGAVYVYDITSTRTPTATVTYSNDADLLGTLDTNTGIDFRAQTGYTDYRVSEAAIITSTDLTTADCNAYGQYTKNTSQIGSWNHLWHLHLYSTDTMSASPTGYEAYHLADQGSGDGTSTRDLVPAASTTLPVWSTTRLTQEITSSEDPVFNEDFDTDNTRGMSLIRTAMARCSKGLYLVMAGDSIFRESAARYGNQLIESLIDAGYSIGSIVGHWRTSFLPVKVTFPSMSQVTTETYCNAEVGSGDLTIPSPSGSDRYGLMCGGIFSITGNGTPVLGTNNRIMTLEVTNAIGDTTWFSDGTRIKAKVTVFYSSLADQYTGTVRFVGASSTVDVDLSSTDCRQHPQDVSWATIQAGTGGAPVDDVLNAASVLVDCGTSGTTRSVEVRLVDGLLDTKTARIGNIQWIVCDASGNPIEGNGVIHPIVHFRDSASFRDLWDARTNTADGQKRCTDNQLGRYLGLWIDDPAADLLYFQILQTEDDDEATVEGNVGDLVTRWDGISTAMNLTTTNKYMFVSHLMNNVDKDNIPDDRTHCIDWRNAYRDASDANPTQVASRHLLDWGKGYIFADSARTYSASNGYTGIGMGEAEEITANATLLAAIGGTADALDLNIIHPNVEAMARAATDWIVAGIQSGSILSPSGGGSIRSRNIARVRSVRRL